MSLFHSDMCFISLGYGEFSEAYAIFMAHVAAFFALKP